MGCMGFVGFAGFMGFNRVHRIQRVSSSRSCSFPSARLSWIRHLELTKSQADGLQYASPTQLLSS